MAAEGHDPHDANAQRAARWLALSCVVLITLGSLYPWHFALPASLDAAWGHLMSRRPWWTGLRDVVGNVVLFVPVGALGLALLRPSRVPVLLGAVLVIGVGVAFAFGLQVAQIFVPKRDAAWSDVVWNTLGVLGGLLLTKPVMRLSIALLGFVECRLGRCRAAR
jgi:VanZ family protein